MLTDWLTRLPSDFQPTQNKYGKHILGSCDHRNLPRDEIRLISIHSLTQSFSIWTWTFSIKSSQNLSKWLVFRQAWPIIHGEVNGVFGATLCQIDILINYRFSCFWRHIGIEKSIWQFVTIDNFHHRQTVDSTICLSTICHELFEKTGQYGWFINWSIDCFSCLTSFSS